MAPLLVSWLAVTAVLAVLLLVRRHLESKEVSWLPLGRIALGDIERQIQQQQQIERKVHALTPVVHWVEAADVILLLSLFALWVYQGLNTVRW